MTNSADPDQLASSEANWSGSTLFANAEHIRVQQDKGSQIDKAILRNSYNFGGGVITCILLSFGMSWCVILKKRNLCISYIGSS